MALNVPPALRARIDQEATEYFGHVDGLLAALDLMESTEPNDRVFLIAQTLAKGLTGTTQQRLDKATALAAAALERLSRKEHRNG